MTRSRVGLLPSGANANMLDGTRELEIALTAENVIRAPRFEVLLNGGQSPVAEHDRPLLSGEDWIVAPTIGAIVPNWLLLIPRDPVLNFRTWTKLHGESPLQLVHNVQLHLGLNADDVIWFEHGPRNKGTSIGCGLDHAHIHILIRPSFSFESFVGKARSMSNLDWTQGGFDEVYRTLNNESSYLIAGSANATIIAEGVEATGSQFFRRVVGALSDIGDAWDYRLYPHAHHISQTIRTFRSLESVARRGS